MSLEIVLESEEWTKEEGPIGEPKRVKPLVEVGISGGSGLVGKAKS